MAEANAGRTDAPPGTSSDTVPAIFTELGRGSWLAAGKRSIQEYKDDFLQDRAAALTYYSIQPFSPAPLVLVSLLGLLGEVGDAAAHHQPARRRRPLRCGRTIFNAYHPPAAAAMPPPRLLIRGDRHRPVVGVRLCRGVHARLNAIYDVPKGRPAWKTYAAPLRRHPAPHRAARGLGADRGVTGGLARQVGQLLGTGSAAITAWDIAKWPVLLVIFSLMFAILKQGTPTPGTVSAGSARAASSPSPSGSSPPGCSRCMSPTSATTTRCTAASPASSSS